MALTRWDPFREALTLWKAVNRLFDESVIRAPRSWPTATGLAVAVDLEETDDDVVVTADLPGLQPDDVDISVTDGTLTMKGEFKSGEEGERGNVHFRERRYGSFQRAISLPAAVNAGKAEAEFEDGVLTVTLPKTEETKPKQIEVKVRS
jgi:HSP20 family protein